MVYGSAILSSTFEISRDCMVSSTETKIESKLHWYFLTYVLCLIICFSDVHLRIKEMELKGNIFHIIAVTRERDEVIIGGNPEHLNHLTIGKIYEFKKLYFPVAHMDGNLYQRGVVIFTCYFRDYSVVYPH